MKQSTLLSMVGSGHTQVSSLSKCESPITDKENVDVESSKMSVSVVDDEDFDVDMIQDDNGEWNQKQSLNLDKQISKADKKQTISYEDFINDTTGIKNNRSFTSTHSNSKENSPGVKKKLDKSKIVIGKAKRRSINKTKSESHTGEKGQDDMSDGDRSKDQTCLQSVSYQDFLGMFKPASASCSVNDSGGKEVISGEEGKGASKEENDLVVPPKNEIIKCKSITSFFKLASKDSNISGNKDRKAFSTFTVTADVHINPDDHSPQKKPRTKIEQPDKVKRSSKTKPDQDDMVEIVLLSSSDDFTSSEPVLKKRKLENVDLTRESDVGQKTKKKKTWTDLFVGDHSQDKEGLHSRNLANSCGQCTLSFGASGLVIHKEKPKPLSQDKAVTKLLDVLPMSSEDPGENVISEYKKAVGKRMKSSCKESRKQDEGDAGDPSVDEKSRQRSLDETNNNNDIVDNPQTEVQGQSEVIGDCDVTDGRKRSSGRLRLRPPKSVEVNVKLESPNSGKQEVEERKNDECSAAKMIVVDEEGCSTPGLRRSSRIKHNAESAKKEVEVIELVSDECEESGNKESRRGGNEKSKTRKSSTAKVVDESSNKCDGSKVARKLAPIFTRLKPAQPEAVKPLPPPPTPQELEKIRARRAFLMSGVPEEVKRAKAALDLQALPEYPPFPRPSHVCQLEDCVGVGVKGPLLRTVNPDLGFGELDDFKREWDSLGWRKQSPSQSGQGERLLFQDFSSHAMLDPRQTDVLIQELHSTDKTFPFKEALDTFAAARDVSHVKEYPVTPTIEDDVIVVDDTTTTPQGKATTDVVPGKSSSNTNGLLWTDHHPVSSKYFIGNEKSLNQLREWLQQWQEELKREARKALKGSKSGKDSRKKARDWSDDSDFTDSSEEDCSLCNTVVLTGPHGVGKTAIVYCLAKEMGFKVFEVNPTSLRSGKQLQAQLEEATQSHRVAQSTLPSSGMFGTPPAGMWKPKPQQDVVKAVEKRPMCKAFNTFFKGSNPVVPDSKKKSEVVIDEKKKETKKKSSSSEVEKKRGKKKKDSEIVTDEKRSEKGTDMGGVSNNNNNNNPLNISSASIILFDEADVVLEEDKGFLSTVQHFMSTTKIPIIITATHPAIHSDLSPRHEHILLRPPSVKTVSSFLQAVCLSRGVCVSHQSLTRLVSVLKQDIRRCLLFMEFWCHSGGGRKTVVKSENSQRFSGMMSTTDDLSIGESVPASDNSNDSDFLSLRPSRKRRKRMCLDDDDEEENEGFSLPNCDDLKSAIPCPKAELADVGDQTTKSTGKGSVGDEVVLTLPPVHTGCHWSLVGGHDLCHSDSAVGDFIKEPHLDLTGTVDAINHFESRLPCSLIYHTALHCCPLPKTKPLPVRLEIKASGKKELPKKRKRILVGDWLDSDCSDDDNGVCLDKDVADDRDDDKVGEGGVICDDKNKENDKKDKGESHLSPCVVENKEFDDLNKKVESEDSGTIVNSDTVTKVTRDASTLKDDEKSPSLTSDYLKVLSRFYETNSCVQSLYGVAGVFEEQDNESCVWPGFSDQEILKGEDEGMNSLRLLSREICGYVDLLSARTLVKSFDVCLKKRKDKEVKNSSGVNLSPSDEHFEEVNCLPIGTEMCDVWRMDTNRRDVDNDSSTKNIASCVGSGGRVLRSRCLHLDYLPVLREMCRFEGDRQATNAKRRFNHYLDYIGMNLRESTRTSLATTYTISPH